MSNYSINSSLCDGCGKCAHVCPHGAVKRMGEKYWIDHMACNACGICKSACPHYALYYVEGTNMGHSGDF